MTGGHGTSNPDVERTREGRKPEENPSGGISRCPWRDMPSEMESQGGSALVSTELSQEGRHLTCSH